MQNSFSCKLHPAQPQDFTWNQHLYVLSIGQNHCGSKSQMLVYGKNKSPGGVLQ